MKKSLAVIVSLIVSSTAIDASMLDQVIYNVVGQVSNAVGARLGDEIYYGSSSSGGQVVRHTTRHHKKRRHKKKRKKVAKKPKVQLLTPEKKLQIALTSLGFYHGKIDGEVNSYETRSAIKELNKAFGISNSASLKPEEKDALIYLGTLLHFDRALIAKGSDKVTKGKKLQTALKIHGVYSSKIDGLVGKGTKTAIKEWKLKRNLTPSGNLDFEEEYQLINSAKEKNDKNIDEVIASLKSLGVNVAVNRVQNTQPQPVNRVQNIQPQPVNRVQNGAVSQTYQPAANLQQPQQNIQQRAVINSQQSNNLAASQSVQSSSVATQNQIQQPISNSNRVINQAPTQNVQNSNQKVIENQNQPTLQKESLPKQQNSPNIPQKKPENSSSSQIAQNTQLSNDNNLTSKDSNKSSQEVVLKQPKR